MSFERSFISTWYQYQYECRGSGIGDGRSVDHNNIIIATIARNSTSTLTTLAATWNETFDQLDRNNVDRMGKRKIGSSETPKMPRWQFYS